MENSQNSIQAAPKDEQALKEDLDHILAVGRILMSVLTGEEKKELSGLLSNKKTPKREVSNDI